MASSRDCGTPAAGPSSWAPTSGIAAALFSVRTSIVSGGVLCIVGTALLALTLPASLAYHGRQGLARKQAEDAARAAGAAS